MDESWKIIRTFFKDNPEYVVEHHLQSYNFFFRKQLSQIFNENNPLRLREEKNKKTDEYKYQCNLYFGGKSGKRIYYGKPIIYDSRDHVHYMYPNEARLRNMTYGFSIHYDIDIEILIADEEGRVEEHIQTINKVYLGRFPIMLQSNLCILKGLAPAARFNLGECRNDPGGYFIIDGKEKVIICQEKFADNMLYIRDTVNDKYSHSAEIRSVSEDVSKPNRTLSVRIVSPTETLSNNQIVVSIPNVKKPVPLFIVMRALGVISDKEIIQYCVLDMEENDFYIDLFRPSIHDAGYVFTQAAALKFIATLTKGRNVLEILMEYFLPHIGELNFKKKALFLGYMVNRLLRVYKKEERPTNRDSYKYKRIEDAGMLIYQLFREYYTLQLKNIYQRMDKEYNYHQPTYQDEHFKDLISNNISLIFANRLVEDGFKKAFKGNWGSQAHTKRLGVVQDLSRLSYFGFICHLRKINLYLPTDSAKIIGPRLLNGTQWGMICPIHTPDGGNVGLHKHMAMASHITTGCSGYPLMRWLRTQGLSLLEESSLDYLFHSTKVFVNGAWVGAIRNPQELITKMKLYRRNALLPLFWSFYWYQERREIILWTDAGRLTRPLFYIRNNKVSYDNSFVQDKMEDITWLECVLGFAEKKQHIKTNNCKIFTPEDLYDFGDDVEKLEENAAIVEYIDVQEEEGTLISKESINPLTTHVEIHPSLILGIMANQIVFPENNPYPRDLFSCGQSKQAVSLYHTNYQNRIDKMAVVLNYGQIPIVKSRYLKYVTNEEHPYGENAIVAIACYSGFNVEDAILVNRSSLDRGLFRTTYFSMYESYEESSSVGDSVIDSNFCNVENENVVGLKPGFDYSHLDEHGLIKENTIVNDKTIIIGKCMNTISSSSTMVDMSLGPKKGQIGLVDKSFLTEGEEGFRLAKIRIREERIPAIGDKFSSRVGQKGTIGLVIPEENMPFTANGIRPDIIVNPHAMPSRMTIGQLIECLMAKVSVLYGGFGDCTAWVNKGPKDKIFGEMLTKAGFHSSGTEVLYNGMTGEPLEASIYMGPTYYMRLKHMVKDKINYRARGPRTILTRQTIGGRAKDGGLRVGEMDRDVIIGHGMSSFLNQSFLERGDEYFVAICNTTGSIAIYNENRDIFLSPMADGPIQFKRNVNNDLNIVNISRFGRDFSIIRVPYAFKLLYQELQAMNVQMRIITEDNIEQLTTLIKGNDVQKLTGLSNITEVSKVVRKQLQNLPIAEPSTKSPTEPLKEWHSGCIHEEWGYLNIAPSFHTYKTSGNAIIVCAGDNSFHFSDDWGNKKRNYVLCVVYYGEDTQILEKYKNNCDIIYHCQGMKWRLIQKVLRSNDWWQTFERIAFPDDDLIFQQPPHEAPLVQAFEQLNKLFAIGREKQFALWQPSLSGLYTVHDILKSQPQCMYRYVNFVESMIPFFSKAAFDTCYKSIMYRNIIMGWGLDDVWATLLLSDDNQRQLAIIDDIVVIHTKPVGEKYPTGVDPHKEMRELKKYFSIKTKIAQNPAVFPPGKKGWPYKHITIKCIPKQKVNVMIPEDKKAGETFMVKMERWNTVRDSYSTERKIRGYPSNPSSSRFIRTIP